MDGGTLLPGGHLRGVVAAPPDKSVSHRAVIAAAIANGTSTITNFLRAEDTMRTLQAVGCLGVPWTFTSDASLVIEGVGLMGLQEPGDVLDCGNSGTTARLMSGVLAAQPFVAVLTGDASLRHRPMARIVEPLELMGAQILGRAQSTRLPLAIAGATPRAIRYASSRASAQVKSAVLFASLYADGVTHFEEPILSRDHTERLFETMGASVTREGCGVSVHGPQHLRPVQLSIPGDLSSVAFWLVAATLAPESDVCIRRVGINPTRTGILEVLEEMGASITRENLAWEGSEPVCDLRVRSASLSAVSVSAAMIPRLVDEVPVLALACALAQGQSEIRGAGELRVKESDRLHMIASQLNRLGAKVVELSDGLRIDGVPHLRGGHVMSAGDHRIAMTLAIAALCTRQEVVIDGVACIQTSYPAFWQDLARLKGEPTSPLH